MDAYEPYTLSDDLWVPQARGVLQTIESLQAGNTTILYSPTGGGKTRQAIELFRWAEHQGLQGAFYLNRRLLLPQTSAAFDRFGLKHGVRAAGYDDWFDPFAPHQICSSDTEASRVIERGDWQLHDAQLVVVDEAHLQRTKAMSWIIKQYKERGAHVVLLTATPVNMKNWADEIVISGRLAEYRDCKALVMAVCKGISIVDLKKVQRNATGEFILDGEKKRIYTQTIVGDVIDYWKEFNPDARPAMAYWPGRAESVWGTTQFEKIGVRWAHVDAVDGYLDGIRAKLTRTMWDDIVGGYKDGTIKGLSSRFRLREGIDLPSTYHIILATPIGSLASYIQTVGRGLRYSEETPDHVIITDHGGAYHNLGSPNHDRDWATLWQMSEHAASTVHRNEIKEGKKPESIVCAKCKTERPFGDTCPSCGYKSSKSKRRVIMESGEITELEGKCIRPNPPRKRYTNTERDWANMYFGYKRKTTNNQSFKQLEGFFIQKHRYRPPKDLPYMPKREIDWYLKVKDVPTSDLIQPSK